MITINTLTNLFVETKLNNFREPRDRKYNINEAYCKGGEVLYKSNQDKDTHIWHLYINKGNFILEREDDPINTRITLFNFYDENKNIQQVDITFDQNMAPFVVFVMDNMSKLWSKSTDLKDITLYGNHPKIMLDKEKLIDTATSDVLLFVSKNRKLYYALQRNNFEDFTLIAENDKCNLIYRVGWTKDNKIGVYWR